MAGDDRAQQGNRPDPHGRSLPRPVGELPEIPSTDPVVEPDTELRAALDALPFKQRGAVVYRYLADLSYADVGVLLDCSEAAARRSAADGIARLRTTYLKGSET